MSIRQQLRQASLRGSLALSLAILGFPASIALSEQLADGTVFFAQVPRLVKATTTVNGVSVLGTTYYFTFTLPEGAGEPLQRLTFNQVEGLDQISLNLKQTRAFADRRYRQPIPLGEITTDPQGLVSVSFDPPVSPGQTVVVGLQSHRNPRNSGVYLFGVTAFPAGEQAYGQFLGYGRLSFYNGSSSF